MDRLPTVDTAGLPTPEDPRSLTAPGIDRLAIRPITGAARRLLVVLAHPDDESFGMGSSLARYVTEGVEVHYACATRGEVGEVDPELLRGHADLGALRTAELTTAARELGLAAVHFLGYRDSGMPGSPENDHPRALVQAPLAQVARQIVGLIRDIRPQVIVTFNPYGGYGHPDHIAIHRATLAAFGAAGDPQQHIDLSADGLDAWEPQKLYFHTFSTANLRWILRGFRLFGKDPRRFGQNGDVDLVRAVEQAGRITTHLDNRAYGAAKERASAAHRSQGGGMAFFGRLPRRLRYRFLGIEEFARIVPPAPHGTPLETDLFVGVDSRPTSQSRA